MIPRHRDVDWWRMAFSNKILLDTFPELAANSAISMRRAKAAGSARPNVSWLSGTKRHAPVKHLVTWYDSVCAQAPSSRVPGDQVHED